jgi:phage tail-like protein
MTGAIGAAIANPTQVAGNMPSSLVALASSLGSMKPAGPIKPGYGMAYKFLVTVDGLKGESLGHWSSCKGLKMEFNPVAVKFGGDFRSTGWLPGPVTYAKVTLQRAVEPEASKAVQAWLKQMTRDWVDPGVAAKDAGVVTIKLFSPNNEPVLTWHLVNARPSSWTGPDLDATSGKIALETLELVHEGFTVTTGTDADNPLPGLSSTVDKGVTLVEAAGVNGAQPRGIQFANSPVDMKVERSTETPTLATAAPNAAPGGGSTGSEGGTESTSPASPPTTPAAQTIVAGYQPNVTRLTLADLYLVQKPGSGRGEKATDVLDNVQLLVDWMTNNRPSTGAQGNASANSARHKLKLKWASFPEQEVYLNSVSATYVQFDTGGKPIRAKVTITVNLEPNTTPPLGNPTSGGIPDRKSHLLIDNDHLALLANQHYGSTARWRDIAEANDLDDPLRARPGQRLFIPARSELGA